jgi:hypothetical protein
MDLENELNDFCLDWLGENPYAMNTFSKTLTFTTRQTGESGSVYSPISVYKALQLFQLSPEISTVLVLSKNGYDRIQINFSYTKDQRSTLFSNLYDKLVPYQYNLISEKVWKNIRLVCKGWRHSADRYTHCPAAKTPIRSIFTSLTFQYSDLLGPLYQKEEWRIHRFKTSSSNENNVQSEINLLASMQLPNLSAVELTELTSSTAASLKR